MTMTQSPFQARVRQLAARFDSNPCKPILSDTELLELCHSIQIHDKIAVETARSEPRLYHLVVLCNMCDSITFTQNRIYFERGSAYFSCPASRGLPGENQTLAEVGAKDIAERAVVCGS
ncbi:unnamed protein product [Periconia digitata]|uniref:Uncharacterized protein n=1 Tax=Periconia digitata TaxID=1303443 RepID=A0A9W4UX63_9PLEO|nr:unnamed protein product [Periconia digitata]